MASLLWLLFLLAGLAGAEQAYTDRTHDSRIFGEPRHYRVFLPTGYAGSTRHYPVIYYFHGHSDRYTLERYDGGLDTVPKISAFVAANDVIVVAADGYVARDYTGFYGGSPYNVRRTGGQFDYGEYFRELVRHIDSEYRTLNSRRYRATSGLSMGGFTSFYLSQRFPLLVGSASAFNPGHEFFAGEPGRRSLWRLKDHVVNHGGTMVRLVRASGDYISQYHEELRAAYASAPEVDFEYRRDEYHRHWATSIGETFAFHMRAFANPALEATPEEWSYTSAYRAFEVRGYRVTLDAPEPAIVYLHDVTQGGLSISTRRWAPDGPSASCASLQLETAPLYHPGERYRIDDHPLTGGAARQSEAVADTAGRLTIRTDCAGHMISVNGTGTGGQPPRLLPVTAGDVLRVRPGQPVELPIRLLNQRAEAMEGVRAELSSEYPTVEILRSQAQVGRIPAATVADLSARFQVRFTAGSGDFARARLQLKITYDGYLTRQTNIDVLVAPDPLRPPVEVVILDGRTRVFRCFRQKGNQGGGFTVQRTVTEGKGNGNGILEPGEEATFWVRLPQGLDPFDKDNWHRAKVYPESPLLLETGDLQEDKEREWIGFHRSSLVRLSPLAAGKEIPMILDLESWSFHFTPDVRYGREPLYQAFQFHQHHLFDGTLKVRGKEAGHP
ncbi:MAG: alpha/beta hydrolase-fold protein [Acidobacteria bacterium]|nr:alpha/beta hydrolase-fold protein [Acidobacteriota bacterium]